MKCRLYVLLFVFCFSLGLQGKEAIKKIGFVIQKDEPFSMSWEHFHKPSTLDLCLITSSNIDQIKPSGTIFSSIFLAKELDVEAIETFCSNYAAEKNVSLNDCYFVTHDKDALELCASLKSKHGALGMDKEIISSGQNNIEKKNVLNESSIPQKNDLTDLLADSDHYIAVCILREGHLLFFNCHQHFYSNEESTNQREIKSGCLIPNTQKNAYRLKAFVASLLPYLPFEDGVIEMEFMKRKNDGEFVFLKASTYLPGGLAGYLTEKAYGINLKTIDYSLQMKIPVPIAKKRFYHTAWFSPEVSLKQMLSSEDIRIKSLYKIIRAVEGAKNLKESGDWILLWNKNPRELYNDLETLRTINENPKPLEIEIEGVVP